MALYSWFTRKSKLDQQDTSLTQQNTETKTLNESMWPTASINHFASFDFQKQAQLAFKNIKTENQSTGRQTKTEVTDTRVTKTGMLIAKNAI